MANKGRPSAYTEELASEILERLAHGESLRSICKDEGKPDESTVREWGGNPKHPFSPHYAHARLLGWLSMADEIVEISDDGSNDWMERHGRDGEVLGWQLNGEHVQRSRLRVDTRKWVLSKCLPKIYGDKVAHEVTGKDGAPMEVTVQQGDLTPARRVAFALGRALDRQKAQKVIDGETG